MINYFVVQNNGSCLSAIQRVSLAAAGFCHMFGECPHGHQTVGIYIHTGSNVQIVQFIHLTDGSTGIPFFHFAKIITLGTNIFTILDQDGTEGKAELDIVFICICLNSSDVGKILIPLKNQITITINITGIRQTLYEFFGFTVDDRQTAATVRVVVTAATYNGIDALDRKSVV